MFRRVQYFHRDEFDHPGLKAWVDQPGDRHAGRQFGIAQDVLDPGAE